MELTSSGDEADIIVVISDFDMILKIILRLIRGKNLCIMCNFYINL